MLLVAILTAGSCLVTDHVLGYVTSTEIIISSVFNLIAAFAFITVWRKVALSSEKNLPILFLSASGIRIVVAAMVVLIYFFVMRSNAQSIKIFAVVFMAFYLMMLVFDTWFFMRTEKTKQIK
jgi:hypothetical protein